MDRLTALRVFCRVAACGSFSQAARELALAQSAASRAVAGLEAKLGLQLFERSTRRVALTIEGRAYRDQIEEHVRALDDADLRARSGFGDLAGRVKLSAPGALGKTLLQPELNRLLLEYPGLAVEAAFTDKKVDLVQGEFDLAFRVGGGSEPSFVEKPIGTSPQWLVASPKLFASSLPPASTDELLGLPAVLSGRAEAFARFGVRVRLVADDLDATLAAALAGVGLSVLPRWLVAHHVDEGRLIRVLAKVPLPGPPIVVVHPRRLRRVSRQVLERLARHLQRELALES
jgi:DNA-binding transcriptional LysR family regulator